MWLQQLPFCKRGFQKQSCQPLQALARCRCNYCSLHELQRADVLKGQATAFNGLAASGLAQKETPADGFLNKCESLLGFTRFQLCSLRTELHRRQLVFSGYDTRLGVL